jgi:2-(3-amino-3-carboxypropyl)histidine synthase
MLRFDLDKALSEIRKRKPERVAVQVPEGLKTALPKIVSEIEKKTKAEVIAFVQPCFGACDLLDEEAKRLGAKLLLHFGHRQFVAKHALETVYIPIEFEAYEKSASVLAERLAAKLQEKGFKKIALCATIQYGKHLALLERELRAKGFRVFVGKAKGLEKGQILGCNYRAVKAVEGKAEAVAFVGEGLFHPLGLSFAGKKPVFVVDAVQREVKELLQERDLFLRKRIAMIEKAKQAKSIAIWVSTKRGQQRTEQAMQLKKKFQEKGKKVFVIASSFVRPDYIQGMNIEAIVCTACPRIALDDSSSFKQPLINASEARIALGEKKLEEYGFDLLC